ncbi:MAG: RAD55 family ATPase [Candidatus Binatia bacterium]
MSDQRISTGIAGLDSLLHGGFVKGRTYLLTGDTGTGKTIACLQMLQQALGQGEKAVYVTVDERPSEITDSALAFSWNLQHHIQEKNLAILDASPYFSGRSASATEKGIDPQKIVADLSNYVKRLGASLLIIDPVTPFILPADANSPTQDQARSLVNLIQTQMTTTNLLTAHLSTRSSHDQTFGIEEFLASGTFLLKVQRAGGKFQRSLTIRKMRSTPVLPGEYPFEINSTHGIVLQDHAAAASVQAAAAPMFEYFQLPPK